MKQKTKAFEIIQMVVISLSVIAIVIVVAFKILGGQMTSELASNTGINCGQIANETANSVAYNGLVSLQKEVTNAITWVGIAVIVVIGFALIRMMTNK